MVTLNREIINIVRNSYFDSEGHFNAPSEVTRFLNPLSENIKKLDYNKVQILTEVSLKQNQITYGRKSVNP